MSVGYVRKWTDTGAPTLVSTTGSLIALLKAVLVDGYGTFASLGWTLPYVSANSLIAAFQNDPEDGTGFYWRILDSIGTAGYAWIFGYEQMTDENTGLLPIHDQEATAGGTNHWLQYGPTTNLGALEWIIIGDNRSAWLCFRPWSYSVNTLGEFNWVFCFIGDYIPVQENNHWPGAIFCRTATAVASISSNQLIGTVSTTPTGVSYYRIARNKTLHYGSINSHLIMGIGTHGSNYIGAFSPTTEFCKMDDPIQPTLPVYLIDPIFGVIGKPPGLRSPGSSYGIDGISVSVSTDHTKVYREYNMGDHKFHFFPYVTTGNDRPGYLAIQSGEGYRDAFV